MKIFSKVLESTPNLQNFREVDKSSIEFVGLLTNLQNLSEFCLSSDKFKEHQDQPSFYQEFFKFSKLKSLKEFVIIMDPRTSFEDLPTNF